MTHRSFHVSLVAGTRHEAILSAAREILSGNGKEGNVPPLWDGRAAERIVDVLLRTEEAV